MIKHNQDGAVNGVVVSLILAVILLLGAIGFGVWSYSSRQDYKDHSDAKVDAAVKVAVANESTIKDKQFAEESKNPLRTYNGPDASGSVIVKYPKTWSGYIKDNGGSGQPTLDSYFNPGEVPPTDQTDAVFALRVKVLDQPYSQVLDTYTPKQSDGRVTIKAYALPKVPKVIGVKVVGTINPQTDGTLVILPLRSETLEIETDGTQFLKDYNTYILPNLSFSP